MCTFNQWELTFGEVKLITAFLLSYPLAGVLKRISDNKPYQKNLFIIAFACHPHIFSDR
jgi:hypothetical protein